MKHPTTPILKIAILLVIISIAACSKKCDYNAAQNKLMALGKVQGRVLAKGGDGLSAFGITLGEEIAPAHEMIATEKYEEACKLLDGVAAKYKIDFAKEMEGMITIEQLAADGGKGTGRCSIADAAKAQMDVHGLLQAEVDAGRKQADIFSSFQNDTRGVADMLSTDPSKVCDLMDKLRKKYGLPPA